MSPTGSSYGSSGRGWRGRDFDGCGALMAPKGHYVDVPVADLETGAFGPAETAARLRLGLERLAGYELHEGPVIAATASW